MLELVNVSHVGEVGHGGSCFQKLMGSVPSAPILKDISLELHAGELMGVLGSSGSGKRVLLEVIARRAIGTSRGAILLNKAGITIRRFHELCAFVPRRSALLGGLSVEQTMRLHAGLTIGARVSDQLRQARTRQVLADWSLSALAQHDVSELTESELRRLALAAHLLRDPLLIVLDEPLNGLDPLNSYLLVSMLANHVKKYCRMALLTVETPRSDIFPHLDRCTILSLGELVYSGYTRSMLDYFHSIGFKCPQMENPLMYFVCLSTVDRRSRDRFQETNCQISTLVERFKFEGEPYRRFEAAPDETSAADFKAPMCSLGRPSVSVRLATLIRRRFQSVFNFEHCSQYAAGNVFVRLVALPLFFSLIALMYWRVDSNSQYDFVTRNGLMLNVLLATALTSVCVTALSGDIFRTLYYQESRDGLYNGATFVLAEFLFSLPINILVVFSSSAIVYWGVGLQPDAWKFFSFSTSLCCCYGFFELQTLCFMVALRGALRVMRYSSILALFQLVAATSTAKLGRKKIN